MKKETTFSEAINAAKKFREQPAEPLLWETAWKKAAASGAIVWPQEIISSNGTYKIEIMQSEEDKNLGIVVISILKNKELIEGRMISVSDGNGRNLLTGKIINSTAYNSNIELSDLNLKLLVNTID